MKTYDFTVKLNVAAITDKLADIVYKVGCGDAIIISNKDGVYLDFCKQGYSLSNAIFKALTDIDKSGYTYSCINIKY